MAARRSARLIAVLWAAMAVCLPACSGLSSQGGGDPTPGATKVDTPSESAPASPSPGTPLPGIPAPTNPADPPVITSKYQTIREPASWTWTLPAGWRSAGWYARVKAAAGPAGTETDELSDQGRPADGWELNWHWHSPQITSLGVNSALDTQKNPARLNCAAQGFDPANQRAGEQITSLVTLCASADFPGAEPAVAQPWAAKESGEVLAALRAHPSASISSPTVTFGAGMYVLVASSVRSYGFTIWLYVR